MGLFDGILRKKDLNSTNQLEIQKDDNTIYGTFKGIDLFLKQVYVQYNGKPILYSLSDKDGNTYVCYACFDEYQEAYITAKEDESIEMIFSGIWNIEQYYHKRDDCIIATKDHTGMIRCYDNMSPEQFFRSFAY